MIKHSRISSNQVNLVVAGAAGRMGRMLIRLIDQVDGVRLHAAIARRQSTFVGKDAGELAGLAKNGVLIVDDPVAAVVGADAILDFSSPPLTTELAALASWEGIVHVIGTTGLSVEDETNIKTASQRARIVKSGNMGIGINILSALVEQAARILPAVDWDIEILEMHHKHKVDAPSGTALLLGGAASKGRQIDLSSHAARPRDGYTGPRSTGTIGYASLRGGSVIGEHSVIFAGEGELISLSHHAADRSNFAHGAIKAALWARNKAPGLYSMQDVLGLGA